MKRQIFYYSTLFLAGFCLYPLIELAWRGRTHFSMAILGGIALVSIALVSIALVDRFSGRCGYLWKAALSAVVITEWELIFGLILNVYLKWNVWDYSARPLNLAGQICPLFSFFWFLLSLVAVFVLRSSFLQGFFFPKKQKRQA